MPQKLPITRGKPFQSKLEPVAGVIAALRKQRKTYVAISRILREQHGISVAPSTIFSFVKVRAKRRNLYQLPETFTRTSSRTSVPSSGVSISSNEAIEKLKQARPASTPKPIFTFDETKPLTLKP